MRNRPHDGFRCLSINWRQEGHRRFRKGNNIDGAHRNNAGLNTMFLTSSAVSSGSPVTTRAALMRWHSASGSLGTIHGEEPKLRRRSPISLTTDFKYEKSQAISPSKCCDSGLVLDALLDNWLELSGCASKSPTGVTSAREVLRGVLPEAAEL